MRKGGVAPVSGHNKGQRNWERPGSRPQCAPTWGAQEDPPPPGRPRGLWEARGRSLDAQSRRGLGTPTRRSPPRGRSARAGPVRPCPAASPGCCRQLVLRPAVLGGGGGKEKEGRKKGEKEGTAAGNRRSGQGGGGRQRAVGQRKGEPNQTRPPRAQTLRSRSGARSPAGSDGGGAYARPQLLPAVRTTSSSGRGGSSCARKARREPSGLGPGPA